MVQDELCTSNQKLYKYRFRWLGTFVYKKTNMKKISFVIALIATVFLPNSFAQTSPVKNLGVLAAYYDVRNALVAGKVEIAALTKQAPQIGARLRMIF